MCDVDSGYPNHCSKWQLPLHVIFTIEVMLAVFDPVEEGEVGEMLTLGHPSSLLKLKKKECFDLGLGEVMNFKFYDSGGHRTKQSI